MTVPVAVPVTALPHIDAADVPLSTRPDMAVRHLPVIAGPDCVGVLLESDVIE